MPGTFAQLTPIALVPDGSDTIHLFAVGQGGTVRTDFCNCTSWVPSSSASGATVAQGTPITSAQGGTAMAGGLFPVWAHGGETVTAPGPP